MQQFKLFGKIISLFSITIVLYSCLGNEISSTEFSYTGEVYFTKRVIDDTTRYALSYFAYGSFPMSSAVVTTTDNTEITLEKYDESGYTYSKVPLSTEYSKDEPIPGTYSFTIIYNDEVYSCIDALEFYDLEFPDTVYFEYNSYNNSISLEWNTVYGADGYIVQMKYENGEIVYSGSWLDSEYTYDTIDLNSGTWNENPISGVSYIVEIMAVRFERTAYSTGDAYNINEIAIREIETAWGEQ